MAIRVTATTSGRFADFVAEAREIAGLAVRAGVEAAGKGMTTDVRQAIFAAGYRARLGNMVGSRVFPAGGRGSLGAAALVSGRGRHAEIILSSLVEGPTIIPKKGRFLPVPTEFNRRGGSGEVLVSPREMLASGRSFTRPAKSGRGLIWFLDVARVEVKGKRGPLPKLVAGGLVTLGSARSGRLKDYAKKGAVPMFVLLRQAHMRRVVDADRLADTWAGRIPGLIDAALPAEL